MLSLTCKTAIKAVIYLASKFESKQKSGIKEVAEFINRSEKIKEWYKKSDSIMNVEFEEVN